MTDCRFSDKWPSLFLIFSLILWYLAHCESSTHWVVTEDGKIQQQANSAFNLRKPHDLVMFIRQELALEKIKAAAPTGNYQKKSQPQSQPMTETEIQHFKTEFYKTNSECVAARKQIAEFPHHLSFIVYLSNKGIDIAEHINLDGPGAKQPKPPYCYTPLPFSMYAFEHLEGVIGRHQLKNPPEHGVRSALAYVNSVDDWGNKIRDSLSKNATSWVLLNLAALYWRVQGSGLQAVECLRRALHYSPREHRDVALMSLANVFHHGNHTLDAVVLMHASMELTADLVNHLFHVGNMYSSIGVYELAELCYRVVIDRNPNFDEARDRLNAVVCEQKLSSTLKGEKRARETPTKHRKRKAKKPKDSSSDDPMQNWYPADTFKRQLQTFLHQSKLSAKNRIKIRTTVLSEDKSSTVQLNEKELNNLQSEIMKGLERANGAPFTINVDLNKELPKPSSIELQKRSSFDQYQEVECREIKKPRVVTSKVKGNSGKGKKKTKKKVKKLSDAKASRSVSAAKGQRNIKKKVSSELNGVEQVAETVENVTVSDNDSNKVDQKLREQETEKNIEILREALDRVKDVLRSAEKNLEHYEAVAKTKMANLRRNEDQGGEEKLNSYLSENSKTVDKQQSKGQSKNISDAKGEDEKQKLPQKRRKSSSKRSRLGRKGESGHIQKPVGDPSGAKGARGGGTEKVFASLDARIPPESSAKGRKRKGEEFILRKNPRVPLEPGGENSDSSEDSNRESRRSGLELNKSDSWNKVKHSRPTELKKSSSSARQCYSLEKSGKKKRRRKGDHLDIECSVSHSDESAIHAQNDQSTTHAQNGESSTHAQNGESSMQAQNGESSTHAQNDQSTMHVQNDESSTHAQNDVLDAKNLSVQISNVSETIEVNKTVGRRANSSVETAEETKILNNNITLRNETLESRNENGTKVPDESSLERKNTGEPAVLDTGLDQQTRRDATDNDIENGKVLDKKANDLVDKRPKVSESKAQNIQNHARTKSRQLKTKVDSNKDRSYKKQVLPSKKKTGMADKKSTVDLRRSEKPNSKRRTRPIGVEVKDEKKEKRSAAEEIDSPSDEAPRELSEDECKDVHGMETLGQAHKHFSAWVSFEPKNIDLRFQVNFYEEVGKFKEPVCDAKIGTAPHTFDHLEGVKKVSKMRFQPETGLTQTLLTLGRKLQPSVQDVGTRIYRAMQKNSTSWVLSNMAALYWRVVGDNSKAVRCLRQALYFSPLRMRDVALVGLASVLLRAGLFEDASVVIRTALLITSDMIVGHFTLANILAAQGELSEAIHHYVTTLHLQPDFKPAMEKLKVIQCVLWQQQKELELEAAKLKKMLAVT